MEEIDPDIFTSPSKKHFLGDATDNINAYELANPSADEIASVDGSVYFFGGEFQTASGHGVQDVDSLLAINYVPKSSTNMEIDPAIFTSPRKKRFLGDATDNISTYELANISADELTTMDKLVSDFQKFSRFSLDALKKGDCRTVQMDLDKLLAINCILKINTTINMDKDIFIYIKKSRLNELGDNLRMTAFGSPKVFPSDIKSRRAETVLINCSNVKDKDQLERKLEDIKNSSNDPIVRHMVRVILVLEDNLTIKSKKRMSELNLPPSFIRIMLYVFKILEELSRNNSNWLFDEALRQTACCRAHYIVGVLKSTNNNHLNCCVGERKPNVDDKNKLEIAIDKFRLGLLHRLEELDKDNIIDI